MHVELQSGTDWAMHAVFDPRAVLHHLNNPALEHVDEKILGPDLDQGNILLYSNSSDGRISVCVCVDEAPPGTWLAHADKCVQDGLLRVPSGVLWACGMEYLCRPGQDQITEETCNVWPSHMGSATYIPPGNYSVDAYEITGPELPEDAGTRLFTCLSLVLSALVGAAAFLAPPPWTYVGLGLVVLLWGVALGLWRRPSRMKRVLAANAFRKSVPCDLVLHLRSLPADADLAGMNGILFGSALGGAPLREPLPRP